MTGKESEFINILEKNRGIVYKICTLYGKTREDREDLFQDIVFQLWRSFSKFSNKSRISTWMYKVALNTAITAYRREKNKPKMQGFSMQQFNIPEINSPCGDDVAELYHAISKLNPFDKSIILLHLDGLSNSEVSEIVSLSQNNVNVRIFRIKSKIRELLEKQWGAYK